MSEEAPQARPGPSLQADCSACAALCCVALAFDKGESFAEDKPAGTPCRHLALHLCSIHDALAQKGFSGCTAYSCQGAGQRVTQELFAGRSWRDDPALLAPMSACFAGMRAAHARLELLEAAAALPLSAPHEAERRHLLAALGPGAGALSRDLLPGFAASALARRIDGFIRGLRPYAQGASRKT